MEFQKSLEESYRRYHLKYKGTRPDYDIHDPSPHVVALDGDYNVDGNGRSILGVNLNYYKGDLRQLIRDINKSDNEAGFTGFEMVAKVRQKLAKDKEKTGEWVASQRKKRYKNFIDNFPYMGKFVRRYKLTGPNGTGVQSQKRAVRKK